MATARTKDAIDALTTFSDKLFKISKFQAQELDGLLRNLRLSAQEERQEVVAHIKAALAEKDKEAAARTAAVTERDKALKTLGVVKEEHERLRKEMRKYATRGPEGLARADSVEPLPSNSPPKKHEASIITAPKDPSTQRDLVPAQPARAADPRRYFTDTVGSSVVADPSSRSARADLYRPPPLKRTRTEDDDGPSTKRRLSHRKPVCGACKKHGKDDECDGGAECNLCGRFGGVTCTYRACEVGELCPLPDCTYLHPSQYSDVVEGGRRRVRDRRGRVVSGPKSKAGRIGL